MQRKLFLQVTLVGSLCAVALLASDFWKTKEYTQWTSDETVKMLTDSPWAKELTVTSGQQGQQRRGGGGRRGGMGGGFPGGGGGYPGGGGGGYPGASGGGGGGYGGGGIREQVVVRWDSALPIQHALLRQGHHPSASEDDSKDASKPAEDINQKYYVVSVLGLSMPTRRNNSDSSDNDRQSADDLRSRFLDAGTLIPRSKIAISAEDVRFEGRNGSTAIRFLFPKTFPLTADEKEIVFQFQSQGIKFDHKFKLSDMQYQGKLAL